MYMIGNNNNNKKIQKACLRGIILHPSTEFKLGNNLDDSLSLLPTAVSPGSHLNYESLTQGLEEPNTPELPLLELSQLPNQTPRFIPANVGLTSTYHFGQAGSLWPLAPEEGAVLSWHLRSSHFLVGSLV